MMRIAYIINSLEGGGAALPVPAVTQVMRDAGAEVEIFALTRRDGRALAAMEAAGLRVHIGAGDGRDQLASLRWLNRAVADFAPSHLWTSLSRATLLGQIIGQWRKIPVISWQHNALLKPWNLRLLKWRQAHAALWVGDSETVTALSAERLGIAPDRLMCWPLFACDAAAPQARAWQAGETLRLGSLGRLHPNKGYDLLGAALIRMKAQGFVPPVPFEISIAGEGGERAALEALQAAGADALKLPGYHDHPKEFLAGLHLYVQPSRHEGFAIAAHEALQAGVPLLCSAVGEMGKTNIAGVTGQVVAPGDVEALAAALVGLLSAPNQLAAMGVAARDHVRTRYSAAAFAAAGRAILDRLS